MKLSVDARTLSVNYHYVFIKYLHLHGGKYCSLEFCVTL